MKIKSFFLFVLSTIFISCSVEQKPIDYGNDKCDNCQMTIVDDKFGAELVNDKGKAYKFDAAECMIRFITTGEIDEDQVALALVTGYTNPGEFIDAKKSYYLISENLPSPMGAFLTSYGDETTAKEHRKKYEGKIYNWEEIFREFMGGMERHKH